MCVARTERGKEGRREGGREKHVVERTRQDWRQLAVFEKAGKEKGGAGNYKGMI